MKKIIRLCLVIPAAVFLFTSIAVAAPGAEKPLTAKKSGNYSVSVSKIQNSKKEKIRLFSNSGEEKVLCSLNGIPGKHYQLFVFDTDSKLVSQIVIRNGETVALNNIVRGEYLYDVLTNDEHIERGQLTVK